MDRFKFEDEVVRNFEFLCKRDGFQCIVVNEFHVLFESKRVAIHIVFDRRRSYEIGLAVHGPGLGPKEPGFSLAEVLEYLGDAQATDLSLVQVSDPKRLATAVRRLASAFERHARKLVDSSNQVYQGLRNQRTRHCLEYQTKTGRARSFSLVDRGRIGVRPRSAKC